MIDPGSLSRRRSAYVASILAFALACTQPEPNSDPDTPSPLVVRAIDGDRDPSQWQVTPLRDLVREMRLRLPINICVRPEATAYDSTLVRWRLSVPVGQLQVAEAPPIVWGFYDDILLVSAANPDATDVLTDGWSRSLLVVFQVAGAPVLSR